MHASGPHTRIHIGTHYSTWAHPTTNCGLSCAVDNNRLQAEAAQRAVALLG